VGPRQISPVMKERFLTGEFFFIGLDLML